MLGVWASFIEVKVGKDIRAIEEVRANIAMTKTRVDNDSQAMRDVKVEGAMA